MSRRSKARQAGMDLKARREALGWPREYTGAMAGLNPSTIWRLEEGKVRRPHWSTVKAYRSALLEGEKAHEEKTA